MMNVSHFSDYGLMILHIMYARSTRHEETIVKEKRDFLYNQLLLRVPVCHDWEIEKIKYDILKLKS